MNVKPDNLYQLPWQADIGLRFSLIQQAPGAILLDSGQPNNNDPARYDIASAWPLAQISPQQDETADVFFARAQLLQQLPASTEPCSNLPFTGGLLGYLGYHFGLPPSRHPRKLPDAHIGLYNWALINDHQQCQSWLFCRADMGSHEQERLLQLFSHNDSTTHTEPDFYLQENFQPLIQPEEYRAGIEHIHAAIRANQCLQVNYTQRFNSHYHGNPWHAYHTLRTQCPTPFAAFVRLNDDSAILSASPERFMSVDNGLVEMRPIKGTRRRGQTVEEDQALAEELLTSEKDRAENLMIVELQKNELAPLCHNIQTPQLLALESYPNVHHLVSCIQAQLDTDKDALDALQHCFPCASISGTPKLPVLQLIDELEASSREIYCGSIFYLDNRGRFDSSVCIRTLLALDGQISCWGGGGITSASEWQAEYQESIDKVQVLMGALQTQHAAPEIEGNTE